MWFYNVSGQGQLVTRYSLYSYVDRQKLVSPLFSLMMTITILITMSLNEASSPIVQVVPAWAHFWQQDLFFVVFKCSLFSKENLPILIWLLFRAELYVNILLQSFKKHSLTDLLALRVLHQWLGGKSLLYVRQEQHVIIQLILPIQREHISRISCLECCRSFCISNEPLVY